MEHRAATPMGPAVPGSRLDRLAEAQGLIRVLVARGMTNRSIAGAIGHGAEEGCRGSQRPPRAGPGPAREAARQPSQLDAPATLDRASVELVDGRFAVTLAITVELDDEAEFRLIHMASGALASAREGER